MRAKRPKNVLYLLADDLRPEFNFTDPWHQPPLATPNFDRLARTSTYFGLAFSQTAFCVPSRASFLTSLRPETTRSVHNDQLHRVGAPRMAPLRPGWTTFDAFRDAGYATAASGKIFHFAEEHPALSMKTIAGTHDLLGRPCDTRRDALDVVEPTEAPYFGFPKVCSLPFGSFTDQRTTAAAVMYMRRLSNGSKPFLLAVGFSRPHNPYQYPTKYLMMQPEANAIDVAAVRRRHPSQPVIAYADSIDCRAIGCEREQRRYYRGAVTYVDALLGILLDELEALHVEASTLVVVHSDHGFSLGENGAWQKRTNFDHATRVPLFVRDPSRPSSFGRNLVHSPVELVDVLPTMYDLAGATKHAAAPDRWQGRSLRSLLEAGNEAPEKAEAARVGEHWRYAWMLQPRMLYLPRHARKKMKKKKKKSVSVLLDGVVAAAAASVVDNTGSDADEGEGPFVRKSGRSLITEVAQPPRDDELNCTLSLLGPGTFGPGRTCQFFAMGFSVRSHSYRYTRWERWPPEGLDLLEALEPARFHEDITNFWTVGEGALLAEELYNYDFRRDADAPESAVRETSRAEEVNLLGTAVASSVEVQRVKAELWHALLLRRKDPNRTAHRQVYTSEAHRGLGASLTQ